MKVISKFHSSVIPSCPWVPLMLLQFKQVFLLPGIYSHYVPICNNCPIKIAEQNSRVKLLNGYILWKEKRKFPQDALPQ